MLSIPCPQRLLSSPYSKKEPHTKALHGSPSKFGARSDEIYRSKQIDELGDCYHYDLGDSSLAVLIDFEKFQEVLAAAGFTISTDYNKQNSAPLDLPESVRFTLLYGDYRVLAAQTHLPAMDRWWTVHIFDSGRSCAHTLVAER